MLKLKKYRSNARGFADELNYAAVIDDGIVLNKDGSLMAGWRYTGPDVDSATDGQLNQLSARMNRALATLGTGFMIHVDSFRDVSHSYPAREASHFPDPVSAAIDDERRRMFLTKAAHFETVHVIVLTYLPASERTSKAAAWMYADEDTRKLHYADQVLTEFKLKLNEFEDKLAGVLDVVRLKGEAYEDEFGRSHIRDHLLGHLQSCIRGERTTINLPPIPMYLDCVLGGRFTAGISAAIDDTRIAVVAIDGFPLDSTPAILAVLDQLPLSYRWSNRFIFLDPVHARAKIDSYRKKWQGKVISILDQITRSQKAVVDQDAVLMRDDAESAMAETNSGLVVYGYYTSVLLLYSNDQARLDRLARKVAQVINNVAGFGARIETLNTVEAYLGSLPGHSKQNIRRPLINTMNLAHFLPITGVWAGRPYAPCPFYPPKAPPLMQVATSGSTPFRFNLHVSDLGHSLLFGPPGSGKSTKLALLAAQFRRYKGSQVFCFDKGYSMQPLTLAVGGTHYDIAGEDSGLTFCPLQYVKTDVDLAWATDWIETMIRLRGQPTNVEMRNKIAHTMNLVRQSTNKTLTDFVMDLQDANAKEALKDYTTEGSLGHLLDSHQDTLGSASFQTFELEHLMSMGDDKVIPILLYLFNRIERRLDGRPSLIILDEAWLALGHEVFANKIVEWLKVLRKANCAVVMATQSLADALNSRILPQLIDSTATKIFLANAEAKETQRTRDQYADLGLNERQIEIIANLRPKREYYVTSADGRRVFDMELGPLTLAFVGASGKDDLQRIRQLHARYGENWPGYWLKERNVHDNPFAAADEYIGARVYA